MIQLAFQPAYDAFHAAFRFFQLRAILGSPVELDKYKILDYYLCFPSELAHFRFSPKHGKYRKLGEQYALTNNFEERPTGHFVLARMRPVQMAALETLEGEGFLSPHLLDELRVSSSAKPTPPEIARRVEYRANNNADLVAAISTLNSDYILVGPNGLKARSNLLEHKYDAI
jgi:hypothetical protein